MNGTTERVSVATDVGRSTWRGQPPPVPLGAPGRAVRSLPQSLSTSTTSASAALRLTDSMPFWADALLS